MNCDPIKMLYRLTQLTKQDVLNCLTYVMQNDHRLEIDDAIIEFLFIIMNGNNSMRGLSAREEILEHVEELLNETPHPNFPDMQNDQ